MGIIGNVLNDKISKYDKKRNNSTIGMIIDYDHVSNKATVQYPQPMGGGMLVRGNVPVANSAGGVWHTGMKFGSRVNITFRGGNALCPVITGELDNKYFEKDFHDLGASLVSEELKDVKKPKNIIPMSTQWTDEENKIVSKTIHSNEFTSITSFYINDDIEEDALQLAREVSHFSNSEQGLINNQQYDNNSVIRLKENGDIDIFVSNDVGIRISKKHGIKFYGMDGMPNVTSERINSTNTDEIIKSNARDKEIIQYSSKIVKLISIMEEIVDSMTEIAKNSKTDYDTMTKFVSEFNTLKKKYMNMVTGTTKKEITDLYESFADLETQMSDSLDEMRKKASL